MAGVSLGATGSSGVAGSVGPSRGWYWVAAGIVMASLVAAFFLARSAFDTLSLSVDPVADDGTFEVHDQQLSVFAPPEVSAPESISCTAIPANGGEPISLSGLGDASINNYESVGELPENVPAGTYRLRCTDGQTVVDLQGFGTQTTDGWPRAILTVILTVIGVIVVGLIAITIVIVTAVQRSSARRRRLDPPPPPYGSAGFPSAPPPMP
jgi:hypothetical protein